MPQRVEDALNIRAARRAEEAAVATESQMVSTRAVVGSPDSSFSFGPRASRPTTGAAGDRYFADDVGWVYYFTGLAWAYLVGIGYGTNAARAGVAVTSVENGAWWFVTDSDVSGGLWRVVSGAWAQQFPQASLAVATSYKVGANEVVGARGAAVADASGGATVDTEARTALNTLLARLRTHGLIET